MTRSPFLDVLEELITTVVDPAAADVDASGTFPRAAVTALSDKGLLGLLGLLSSTEVGGLGGTLADASCSLGLMDAGVAKTIGHATTARFEHLDQVLADQPVVRQHVAAMKNQADAASTLVDDAIAALAEGRPDAPLRMLQSKGVAGEAGRALCGMPLFA